jgi:dipeptidyl aminopeptidase/acylaminoacyl peptidase
VKRTYAISLSILLALTASAAAPADKPGLLTVAEQSDFKATSKHAQVIDFCQRLAKASPLVRIVEFGKTSEGKVLPAIVLADPPVSTPEEAAGSNKLVVYAQGNIHAGEVDAKEGLMMLARDLAMAPERSLLKDLIIVILPDFNADGNDRMSKTSRRGQVGPEEGQGVRANGQGLDLNRDFVKLESPEVRALARFVDKWDPAVVIDGHTTNGSYHRYTLTYEGPRCPAGDGDLIAFVRDTLFPDVGQRLKTHSGFESFFYGNFNNDRTRWETVPPTPRYSTHYIGLRNRIGILSESYSYASYRDRILASRDFARSIFEFTAANKDKVSQLLKQARDKAVQAGKSPKPEDRVALRFNPAPVSNLTNFLGFVEEQKDGHNVPTKKLKQYPLHYWGNTTATLTVERPYAYLFPASETKAVENLQRHGVTVEELHEDIELDVQVYRVDKLKHEARDFQGHKTLEIEASARSDARRMPTGTIVVRTGQPLGDLIVYLLEPGSEDGLATWNFFDDLLREGHDFPVVRLPKSVPVSTGHVRPLPEERTLNKPVTFEDLYGSGRRSTLRALMGGARRRFSGERSIEWLPDGEHYLQTKEGRLAKVQALTGRSQPYFDSSKLAQALGAVPTMGREAARSLARSPSLHMNPQRTAAVFEHENDLYYATLDGSQARRLTKTPGVKEYVSFSPNGQFLAFVRDHNLHVVDVATATERALTTDGSGIVSNGKPDWVYWEEIYNHGKAFWWSPNSSAIAFVRFDDTPVHRFTVLDHIPTRLNVENTPYPKAGDPNPLAKLGIVSVGGGGVAFADLSDYSDTSSLVTHAGWFPESAGVYFYVQDRAQTWLDFCTVPTSGGKPARLFRETTKAWVDDPGDVTFLTDGTFLMFSERTGWKHLYRFGRDGSLKGPVTSGLWEVHTLHQVDEKNGWVYFSGGLDSAIADNLYRVRLEGGNPERLTDGNGNHDVNLSPRVDLFVDTHGSFGTPTRVDLVRIDGARARTIDVNPLYELEEYRLGKSRLVKITTPDNFILNGSLLLPPDYDPGKRYPAWFTTYAGPHAPMIGDRWNLALNDQLLANLGFIVFHCDPRSASGKGAVATWSAYRQLGVQELKDIDTAIQWLKANAAVDPERIGMQGHSYGGFMTAYAMTHSKLFAAGIAGAPVTDWRNYDSIYTERYMNTPQENPDGYDKTSVVKAAGNLHGRLLILHGVMDDNVHIQNTIQLIDALERANKDFEVMFYPRNRHPISGLHYQRLMLGFIQRTLAPSSLENEKKTLRGRDEHAQ